MSPILQSLELGAANVCRGDWRNNISDELKEGVLLVEMLTFPHSCIKISGASQGPCIKTPGAIRTNSS